MNRRSVLRWLGLAPVAAPAAVAAASAPALPPVDYSALTANMGNVQARILHSEQNIARLDECISRARADAELCTRIDGTISRIGQAEARIVSEQSARTAGSVDVCRTGLLTTHIG